MTAQIIATCLMLIFGLPMHAQDFLSAQLKHERVQKAMEDHDAAWRSLLEDRGLPCPPEGLYLRAFKFDKQLEAWAYSSSVGYVLLKTYDICEVSGQLGPKRRQGDQQIPEGFYRLTNFNPASNYHLSLRINYPNTADSILSAETDPGGDIYIHGDCVTVGCLPIQDGPISELYWLAALVRQGGGEIPVHIFPFRMDEASLSFFRRLPDMGEALWDFWGQLLPAYRHFEEHRMLPGIDVDPSGRYVLSKGVNAVNK